jgi:anti-sigma factor RsiW
MESTPVNPNDEMACRELVEVVTDYLEGALGDDDRRRLESHLEECPYCAEYVAQMRETVAALGEISPDSLTPETRRDLLDAFRGWRNR